MTTEDAGGDRNFFVSARSKLSVGNAVAAIMVLNDGRYLLQLRDDAEPIWYPGHWGCFGGGVESDEEPLAALRRELHEELNVEFDEAIFFTEFVFDLKGLNLGRYYRRYYLVKLGQEVLAHVRLGEGSAVRAFDSDTMLGGLSISPYDAFALFLYARAFRLCESK